MNYKNLKHIKNRRIGESELDPRARVSSATTGIFAIAREGCLSGLQRGS